MTSTRPEAGMTTCAASSPAARLLTSVALAAVLLSACLSAPQANSTGIAQTQAFETALAQLSVPTSTPAASATPLPTATVPRTPPALPGPYQSSLLDPWNTPHTYLNDTCQYLRAKWDSNNAAPGTIVMVVMLHSIQRDPVASSPMHITLADFRRMMDGLHEQGFQAINATQLADFLDTNAKLPPRSVLIIQDDRHSAQNYEDFRTYWDQWGWPVVNAWISLDGGNDKDLQGNVALASEGWVDYQAHGVVHNINMTDASTDEFIRSELQGSKTNLETYFHKTPIAIIWPGGGFGLRPAQIARELGYRLGFTVNPRGPIMFNWVPLADEATPGRADMLSEGYVGDPRMTLPRYWPSQVLEQLDNVRLMGEEARQYAEQSRAIEMEYYDISCLASLGPIP